MSDIEVLKKKPACRAVVAYEEALSNPGSEIIISERYPPDSEAVEVYNKIMGFTSGYPDDIEMVGWLGDDKLPERPGTTYPLKEIHFRNNSVIKFA